MRAHLADEPAPPPQDSRFSNLQLARKFAGPLPFTFDYDEETDSIVRVQGVRQAWDPKTVGVEVLQNTFIEKEPFASALPILASAFHLANVSYRCPMLKVMNPKQVPMNVSNTLQTLIKAKTS